MTDVLLLTDGELDRRMQKIRSLELPLRTVRWLSEPEALEPVPGARVLSRGAVIDLPDASSWTINATWAQQTACEVDMVAFALDEDGQVSADEDFVFYGAPDMPDGSIQLSTNGPTEQSITLDLAALPVQVERVTIAAAIDGTTTFGEVGAIEINAVPGSEGPYAEAALDAATTERTLLLADLYRRNGAWRLRAVGQGYDHDLAALARDHGVDVAE